MGDASLNVRYGKLQNNLNMKRDGCAVAVFARLILPCVVLIDISLACESIRMSESPNVLCKERAGATSNVVEVEAISRSRFYAFSLSFFFNILTLLEKSSELNIFEIVSNILELFLFSKSLAKASAEDHNSWPDSRVS